MAFTTPMVKPTTPIQKGESVRSRQQLLALRGYNPGSIDGQYGAKSQDACRRFQQSRGLTVDGIIGDNTLRRLLDG